MTDFSDFTTQVAEWANREDWSPTLVASFVRMGEQKLNAELRVDRMIKTDDALISGCCAPLPLDWLEADFVRIGASSASDCCGTDFWPITYKSRHEFFRISQRWKHRYYTIEGRQIFFGGASDAINGRVVRLDYYAEVPVFSDTVDSWIYTKYPSLYLSATMMHVYMHAVGEEPQAAGAKQLTEDAIAKLNNNHLRSKASGSRLMRTQTRSFG